MRIYYLIKGDKYDEYNKSREKSVKNKGDVWSLEWRRIGIERGMKVPDYDKAPEYQRITEIGGSYSLVKDRKRYYLAALGQKFLLDEWDDSMYHNLIREKGLGDILQQTYDNINSPNANRKRKTISRSLDTTPLSKRQKTIQPPTYEEELKKLMTRQKNERSALEVRFEKEMLHLKRRFKKDDQDDLQDTPTV